MFTRRQFVTTTNSLAAAAALGELFGVASSLAQQPSAQPPDLGPNRLVTLGTRGGPAIRTGFTPSPSANLIVFDNVPYVIDTGYGVSGKLVQSKFPLPQLRYVFITHHHSDRSAQFRLAARL
jgi:Metallo-beta-lactamase superfamily